MAAENEAVEITVTLSGFPAPEELVYVRYTTDGFGSTSYALVDFGATPSVTGTATIPGQSAGTTVQYYVLSTTVPLSPPPGDPDMLTINFNNNGGSNYSYSVAATAATTAGNWTTPGTWNTNLVPDGAGATGIVNANVTVDTDIDLLNLTVNGGGTLNLGAQTITIADGGTVNVSGTVNAGTGTLAFAGGATMSGSATWYDVTASGLVNFGGGHTVNRRFEILSGGGATVNRPIYASGSTLRYNTGGTYNSNLEWEGGLPHHVEVVAGTTLILDNPFTFECNGDLTIAGTVNVENSALDVGVFGDFILEATGAMTLSGESGDDLFIRGDAAFDGTFDSNERAVFFDFGANQTISGSVDIDVVIMDKGAGTLSLAAGADLGIIEGIELINGTLNTTAGTLTLRSDAAGTAWLDDFSSGFTGTLTGNLTVQRYIPGSGVKYHFLTAPVGGATVGGQLAELSPSGSGFIVPLASCDATQIDAASPYGTVFRWHEAGPPGGFLFGCEQSGWEVVSGGTTMNPGEGFAAYATGGTTIDLSGSLTTGTVTYASLGWTNAIGDGWHMVGNPYPSPITWNAPAGFEAAAQLFQNSGGYSGTFDDRLAGEQIESMQGFQVRVNPASPGPHAYSLGNADRTRTGGTFERRAAWYEQMLVLDVAGNGFMDKTRVYFSADAEEAFDPYTHDSRKKESATGQPTLYTLTDGEMTATNGRSALSDGPRSIPMGLLPGADGSFTFSVKTWEGFPATARLFLEDLVTGTWTDLLQGDYTATMGVSENPDRFVLHFRPGTVADLTMAGCADDAGRIDLDLGDGSVGGTLGWTAYTLRDGTGATIAAGTPSATMAFDGLASGEYALELQAGTLTAVETYTIDAAATASAGFTPDAPEAEAGLPLRLRTDDPQAVSADWAFGDGQTATGVLEPLHTWTEPGFYPVEHTVYSADGCVETRTVEMAVRGSTGVPSAAADITVWTQGLTIGVDAGPETERIALTDLAGRRVANAPCTASPCTIQAPAAGYYLLLLERDGQRLVRRVAVTD